jgi:hypothetical protein
MPPSSQSFTLPEGTDTLDCIGCIAHPRPVMILRLWSSIALIASLMLVQGQAAEMPLLPVTAGHAPTLLIYLAKGPPNACGPGCDRWIAVEGMVDAQAAPRIGQFLRSVKDTTLPFYFYSPGGEVRQAFAIGRLLRARKAIGRVGQTVADGCTGAQSEADCLKIKTAGGEVAAHIVTRNAICHSACSYLLFGALTREVAMDAAMAVHSVKIVPVFRGSPTADQREQFVDRAGRQEDRVQSAYIEAMGMSSELADLIDTVKFETPHFLTRQELFRFHIDPRSLVETDWSFEPSRRPFVRKRALLKNADGPVFRVMEWRLSCETDGTVALSAGSATLPAFDPEPDRFGPLEAWTAMMTETDVAKLLAVSHLEVGQIGLTADGKVTQSTFEIETGHLADAWAQLHAACAAKPGVVANRTVFPAPVVPTRTPSSVAVAPVAKSVAQPIVSEPK